ncbi:MAG: HAMP domain-containing protein [Phycisphaerales bacterium JB039]
MLRRKLLSRIGLLIGAFVIGAVVAIVLLQNVVTEIDAVNHDAEDLAGGAQELSHAITSIESDRLGAPSADASAAGVTEALIQFQAALTRLGAHPAVSTGGPAAAAHRQIAETFPALHKAAMDDRPDDLRALAIEMREHIWSFDRAAGDYLSEQRSALGFKFRALVLGLTLAAMLMVNVSVIVLLRALQMILRPVDELVAASRELAHERFDRRITIDRNDEFGELAQAYNLLGEHLGANEQRKMETLHQAAIALNHDLNNAISVIELQLKLVGHRSLGDSVLNERLQRIHESLARVAAVVRALTHIRRIVLTEYMPGQLMLDLQRSTEEDSAESGPSQVRAEAHHA